MTNFDKMSTKKLKAALADENTTAEEKMQIEKIIAKREEAANAAPTTTKLPSGSVVVEMPADEEPAEQVAEPKSKKKISDEERIALATELRETCVNHRCTVVPFNSLDWVNGVVVSIIEEKTTNRVLYAVKSDDNKRIVKPYGSQLIKILDEVVEPVKRSKKQVLDENGNPIVAGVKEWSTEELEAAIALVICNVGKKVTFKEAGRYGVVEDGAKDITGRIISLVPNKRQQTILYRIEFVDESGETKISHKVSSNAGLIIEPEFDETGAALNEAFVSRRNNKNAKVVLTPEEALAAAEAAYKKAEEAVERAKATLEKRAVELEVARQALGQTAESAESADELS